MGYPLTIMQQRHPLLRWLLAALLVVSSYTNSGNMSQEFVTCPFNSAHTVSRHRLQNHVEKCKKVIDSTVFSIRLAGLKKKQSPDQLLLCSVTGSRRPILFST